MKNVMLALGWFLLGFVCGAVFLFFYILGGGAH